MISELTPPLVLSLLASFFGCSAHAIDLSRLSESVPMAAAEDEAGFAEFARDFETARALPADMGMMVFESGSGGSGRPNR